MSLMTTNYVKSTDPDIFERVKGSAGRMFVEVGNAEFYEGRQYFTFHEFTIASAAVGVYKVVITEDVLMLDFVVNLSTATTTVEIVSGGTEGGSFSTPLPITRTNNMLRTPARATTSTMSYGGTHTGGTVLDKFLLDAGHNVNHSTAVLGGEQFAVGFPPGTYYVRITNTNNQSCTGMFKARWEENPN